MPGIEVLFAQIASFISRDTTPPPIETPAPTLTPTVSPALNQGAMGTAFPISSLFISTALSCASLFTLVVNMSRNATQKDRKNILNWVIFGFFFLLAALLFFCGSIDIVYPFCGGVILIADIVGVLYFLRASNRPEGEISPDNLKGQITAIEKEKQGLEIAKNELSGKINSLEVVLETSTKEKSALEENISMLRSQIANMAEEIIKKQDESNKLDDVDVMMTGVIYFLEKRDYARAEQSAIEALKLYILDHIHMSLKTYLDNKGMSDTDPHVSLFMVDNKDETGATKGFKVLTSTNLSDRQIKEIEKEFFWETAAEGGAKGMASLCAKSGKPVIIKDLEAMSAVEEEMYVEIVPNEKHGLLYCHPHKLVVGGKPETKKPLFEGTVAVINVTAPNKRVCSTGKVIASEEEYKDIFLKIAYYLNLYNFNIASLVYLYRIAGYLKRTDPQP